MTAAYIVAKGTSRPTLVAAQQTPKRPNGFSNEHSAILQIGLSGYPREGINGKHTSKTAFSNRGATDCVAWCSASAE